MIEWLTELLGVSAINLISPIATLVSATIAACLAWTALRTSAAVNLRNKRIDIITDCNKRYDALAQTKTAIIMAVAAIEHNTADEHSRRRELQRVQHEIELYHRRFWGLKSDQIDYWLAGYVDPETLISWFMSTIEAIHNPVALWRDLEGTAMGGWRLVSASHEITNRRLFQVINFLSRKNVGQMSQDQRYTHLFKMFRFIERVEWPLITMLRRNNHRRLTMRRFKSKLPPRILNRLERRDEMRLRASFRQLR